MAGVLEGIRVVDMSHAVAMPSASVIFADWGADVIKVEPPSGELIRGITRSMGVDRQMKFDGGQLDYIVELHNRNKRGLALDLKKESGREILYRLVKTADVFASNYEASALKKLKLDYATSSKHNPRLIYAIITGYGTVGPDKDERGYDHAAA